MLGGPQPRLEHSPILFEKAKDAILHYPDITPNATDDEEQDITKAKHERQKRKEEKDVAKWSRTKDPDVVADNSSSTLATNSPMYIFDEYFLQLLFGFLLLSVQIEGLNL